ncbi:hypothetical protein GFS31_33560 [Leptolyngbya sp. BL0902]|nr:hypothetical protein GFS31_33560 [Leptolyngbya sp. BL0902]
MQAKEPSLQSRPRDAQNEPTPCDCCLRSHYFPLAYQLTAKP